MVGVFVGLRRTIVLLGVLVTAAGGVQLAGADAATPKAKALQVLAGTNTFRATFSGETELIVPRSTILEASKPGFFSVAGTGRVVRFSLSEIKPVGQYGADSFSFERLPKKYQDKDSVYGTAEGFQGVCPLPPVADLGVEHLCIGSFGRDYRLHAGRYKLRIVIDKEPVTFRLTTKNLKGTAQIGLTHRIYTHIEDIKDSSTIPSAAFGGVGERSQVQRFIDTYFWWDQIPGAGSVYGTCSYESTNGQLLPGFPAFMPVCPESPLPQHEGPDVRNAVLGLGHDEHHTMKGFASSYEPRSAGGSVIAAGVKNFGGLFVSVENRYLPTNG